MKPIDIPYLQDLCATIRAILPDAVISGGAVRDTLHGAPIKDIDVMCSRIEHGLGLSDREVLKFLATHVGGSLVESICLDPSGCDEFEYTILMPDGHPPLNVIDLSGFDITDPIENLHDFDFGLSQVAVVPSGVIMTPAYVDDWRQKAITYMGDKPEAWRNESSAKRLQRLKAKYPTWDGWWYRGCASLEARV